MTTLNILGISGSLRTKSMNTYALQAAGQLMPEGMKLTITSLADIPLYNQDVQDQGIPASVTRLCDEIARADGLLIASPEYNFSISGVLKNAIDWLSRPSSDIARVFGDRAIAVIGASPGGFGTILAQNAWLPVLRTLGTRPWFGGRLMVSRAGQVFNETGEMVDEKMKGQLQQFLQGFAASLQQ